MAKTKLKFVTLETLLEMKANNEKFKLVEVLSEENFGGGHIPGAVNLPLDKLEKLAPEKLKKNESIMVYCASYACHASTRAARLLLDLGYKKILDYKGGKKGWIAAGLELER